MRREHGLLTPAELAAQQEARDHARMRQMIADRDEDALWAYRAAQSAPAPSAGHLIAIALVCLVSSFAVMALWSVVLGFVLAIVAALVIAGAAIGGE